MATYTQRLIDVIESTNGTVETQNMTFKGVDMGAISLLTGSEIGIHGMPIFDAEYKPILIGKIVDHFWLREIGFETVDIFRLKMRTKLNESMAFYNQLYKSTLVEYEALSTINLKTESTSKTDGTESSTGNNTGESTSESGSRAVASTTPQTQLSGYEDYASSATDTTSKSKNNSVNDTTAEATSSTESEGDTLVSGYQGTPADLIMRFRDSLINVDLMVIRDLEELFMQTFDNADSYTGGFGHYGYY